MRATLRIAQYFFVIVILSVAIRSDAGWLSGSTPQEQLETTGDPWFLNEQNEVEKDPWVNQFKFSGGKIMSKGNSDRWIMRGSYAFQSKRTMLVFWGGSKVGRLVELSIDTSKYTHKMSWYVQDDEPDYAKWEDRKMKCWFYFEKNHIRD